MKLIPEWLRWRVREVVLVRNLVKERPGSFDALLEHLQNRPMDFTRVSPTSFIGVLGCIRICNDIYGYEIDMGYNPIRGMIDTHPSNYGLSHEQGNALFNACMPWIRGSSDWVERKRNEPKWPRS